MNRRSASWAKSVHLNRPGKKHNSGLGLPPKINKQTKKETFNDVAIGERFITIVFKNLLGKQGRIVLLVLPTPELLIACFTRSPR